MLKLNNLHHSLFTIVLLFVGFTSALGQGRINIEQAESLVGGKNEAGEQNDNFQHFLKMYLIVSLMSDFEEVLQQSGRLNRFLYQ